MNVLSTATNRIIGNDFIDGNFEITQATRISIMGLLPLVLPYKPPKFFSKIFLYRKETINSITIIVY